MSENRITESKPLSERDFVFTERKETPFFKFEKLDDEVSGYFVAIDPVVIGENRTRTMQYTLEQFGGKGRIRINGTRNINDKLGPADLGRPIRVKFVGKNEQAGRNGNAMHLFLVSIDFREQVRRPDLVIVDAD